RAEVTMLAVAPLAEGDLGGRRTAERERGDREQRRIDRRRANRLPVVEPVVGEVAVRAASERRRVRRQRPLVLERGVRMAVVAANGQPRLERLRRIDLRQ